MQHAVSLTPTGLGNAMAGCPQLLKLDISGSMNVNDRSIKTLTLACPRLAHLNVTGCGKLTDLALKHVAAHCPDMEVMIMGCTNG